MIHRLSAGLVSSLLLVTMATCLGEFDTSNSTSSNIVCHLTFSQSSQQQMQASTIELRILNDKAGLIWGPQTFSFEDHGATMTGVPSGTAYRVYAGAYEQDGTFLCNGFSQVFDAPAGQTVDAGTVTMRPFGTFVVSSQYINTSHSYGVRFGDMDHDGDLDVLVVNASYYNELWFNDGQGFLSFGQYFGYADFNGELDLGDLDGDGDLDVFNVSLSGRPDSAWFNDGNGFLSLAGPEFTGIDSWGVDMGDLDGDSDLDVFIANRSGPNKVLFNDGQGIFSDSNQELGNAESLFVQLGDLDGDGDLDAFVANDGPTNEIGAPDKVWFNNGNGQFTAGTQDIGDKRSFEVALGDVDGDGDLDAVTAHLYGSINTVWLNDGHGSFTDSGQDLISPSGMGVCLGDIDRDGDLDIYFTNGYEEPDRVFQNNGLGVFIDTGMRLGNVYAVSGALGDLNGDGFLDAFAANIQIGPTGSAEDKIYFYVP